MIIGYPMAIGPYPPVFFVEMVGVNQDTVQIKEHSVTG